MGKFSRSKGARGEREVVNMLREVLPHEDIARNLQQSINGGSDVILVPFYIEVKKAKKLLLDKWWEQTLEQLPESHFTPVLVYKKDYAPWRARMLHVLRNDMAPTLCDISIDDFLIYVKHTCKAASGIYNDRRSVEAFRSATLVS